MSDFSLVTEHPDFDEIVAKIVSGTPVKDIVIFLKLKYHDKDQKHLHLSHKIIQEYADKNINLVAQLKRDIQAVKAGGTALTEYKIPASLANNKTYQERLIALADTKLDLARTTENLVHMAQARLEQMFDLAQQNPTSSKPDYVLIKWFEVIFNGLEKFDKFTNNKPEQIIQHNVNIQVNEQYTYLIQECIMRTLTHIDSEAAALFMEIFTDEMKKLRPPQEETPEELKEEATLLKQAIILAESNPDQLGTNE